MERHIDNVSQSSSDAQDHNKYEPTYTDLRFDTLFRGDGGFLGGNDALGVGELVRLRAAGSSDSLTIIKSGL